MDAGRRSFKNGHPDIFSTIANQLFQHTLIIYPLHKYKSREREREREREEIIQSTNQQSTHSYSANIQQCQSADGQVTVIRWRPNRSVSLPFRFCSNVFCSYQVPPATCIQSQLSDRRSCFHRQQIIYYI
ncbi:Kappa-scoloptoxin(11)-Ss1a [Trichinella pseudospiralis]